MSPATTMTIPPSLMTPHTPTRRPAALVRAVETTIHRHELMAPGMSVLVALSGGPDSVALLHALKRLAPAWRFTLTAVHCNYGLRGAESAEDEAFVTQLCTRLDIPCTVRHLTLPGAGAARRRRSQQAQARDLRYQVFDELAEQTGAHRVALAHTADDQAETVLLWMVRGAGSTGLSGMPIARDQRIVRPLLEATRAEVLQYLADEGLAFRTDSSNATLRYRRNRIRHELLPLLVRLNPAIVRTLARQADLSASDDGFLQTLAQRWLTAYAPRTPTGEWVLDRRQLQAEPLALQRRILRQVLRETHPGGRAPSLRAVTMIVDRLLMGRSGTALTLSHATVRRDYDRVIVRTRLCTASLPASQPTGEHARHETLRQTEQVVAGFPMTLSWAPTGQTVRLRLEPAGTTVPKTVGGQTSAIILFDADRLSSHHLELRAWRPGDWFCPAGMGGHRKKLHDYWIDAKVPRPDRAITPLLVSPDGVLWVVGHRADQRFLAGPTTTRVLVAEVGAGNGRDSREEE